MGEFVDYALPINSPFLKRTSMDPFHRTDFVCFTLDFQP